MIQMLLHSRQASMFVSLWERLELPGDLIT
jgi:hypothetical protein